MNTAWQFTQGEGPLVAAAVHAGHSVRQDVAGRLAISAADRLREEDPCTDRWTTVAGSRIVVLRSRFEVDLNRPRARAVYLDPADAWGLNVWQAAPPAQLIAESQAIHDAFYAQLRPYLQGMVDRHGRVVVIDLHSYNHRRGGPHAPPDSALANPEVNVGTGTMDRGRWRAVVERYVDDLRRFDFLGRRLDVRENVRFQGGHLAQWTHQHFPESVCVLSIEVKKFFMDEWTGKLNEPLFAALHAALKSAAAGVMQMLSAPP